MTQKDDKIRNRQAPVGQPMVSQSPDGHQVEITCGTARLKIVASKKQRGQWNLWMLTTSASNIDCMIAALQAARGLLPKMEIHLMEIGQVCYEQP